MKVLIADDDRDIAEVVEINAQLLWPMCQVVITADGAQVLELFSTEQPDLVILDIGLPPPDGQELCRLIRQMSDVPIMMLSAREGTVDKVRAFDSGADDYVTKPFDHFELQARLRAIVRRHTTVPSATNPQNDSAHSDDVPGQTLCVGDLTLNIDAHQLLVEGNQVQLTSTECRFLAELMRHPGRLMPYRLLLERVWGSEYKTEDKYLKVFIWRLRRKLGGGTRQRHYIQNEWGIGYKFMVGT
ncbi:MAG TPA: response regulator transcription factor [Chloroflexia bacterium]|nr:response regulator transcription factor [Chloroflexia bacterium]